MVYVEAIEGGCDVGLVLAQKVSDAPGDGPDRAGVTGDRY